MSQLIYFQQRILGLQRHFYKVTTIVNGQNIIAMFILIGQILISTKISHASHFFHKFLFGAPSHALLSKFLFPQNFFPFLHKISQNFVSHYNSFSQGFFPQNFALSLSLMILPFSLSPHLFDLSLFTLPPTPTHCQHHPLPALPTHCQPPYHAPPSPSNNFTPSSPSHDFASPFPPSLISSLSSPYPCQPLPQPPASPSSNSYFLHPICAWGNM